MSTVEREIVIGVTAADVLHRAADLLEEFGHCQHKAARDKNGEHVNWRSHSARSFCIAGAVCRAAIDLGYGDDEFYDVIGRIAPTTPYYSFVDGLLGDEDVWQWNDRPGRTKAEVVARLREAAGR